MAYNIFVNIDASNQASAVVADVSQPRTPKSIPSFTIGDNKDFNVYFIDNEGAYASWSNDLTYVVEIGFGPVSGVPTSGTGYLIDEGNSATSGTLINGQRYKITDYQSGDDFSNIGGTNEDNAIFTATGTTPTTWTNSSTLKPITSDLAYNISATDLQTALNAMNNNAGPHGGTVTVTKSHDGYYNIRTNVNGVVTTMSGNGDNFDPDSAIVVSEIIAGTTSVRKKQSVKFVRQPAIFQDTWSSITNGRTGKLNANTNRAYEALGGAASISHTLEIQVTDPSGNRSTFAKVPATLKGEVVDESSLDPDNLPGVLTKNAALNQYIGNRSAITSLTGGTSSDLDGIATVDLTVGVLAAVEVATGVYDIYRLYSGTDAESSPDIIRPDDHTASTNEKVWKRVASRVAVTLETTNSTGNTTLTMPLGISTYNVEVTFSGSAGTRIIILSTANAKDGDVINMTFINPTTSAIVEEVRNATSGGTLLDTTTTDTSGDDVFVSCKFNGTAWKLQCAQYPNT